MYIERLFGTPIGWDPDPIFLWAENMHEPWSDYDGADRFVVRDENSGDILGGFAVYRDDSDGIKGLFCSGWAARHKKVPCADILKQLVKNVGPVYFKTDQRTAKFLLEKIGKKVKNTGRFVYYIVKR
jgi:hypothetical protein